MLMMSNPTATGSRTSHYRRRFSQTHRSLPGSSSCSSSLCPTKTRLLSPFWTTAHGLNRPELLVSASGIKLFGSDQRTAAKEVSTAGRSLRLVVKRQLLSPSWACGASIGRKHFPPKCCPNCPKMSRKEQRGCTGLQRLSKM
ncbi:hypothetical protein AMECASPLE_011064 [Ameca splendens]|uniref:Uncharacterized protein n=1 Tax=Ameca splendens TaxID=208324 RepID=A0ABV0YBV5_9TELE